MPACSACGSECGGTAVHPSSVSRGAAASASLSGQSRARSCGGGGGSAPPSAMLPPPECATDGVAPFPLRTSVGPSSPVVVNPVGTGRSAASMMEA
eukprot:scaffold79374_cov72-Phaeocystis_antarctica.AAC.5